MRGLNKITVIVAIHLPISHHIAPHFLHAQTERAFQKQPTVYVGKARVLGTKAGKGKGVRFTKNIGLGFKTPKEAIEGKYIDKKCPFTGNVSIRGRILRGVVVSTKMKRTIIVRRDYLHYVPKYNRFEKRHKNIPAHCSPAFTLKEGDVVTVGQCRYRAAPPQYL
jgi:small subunit ribosomal protein S11e